MDVLQVLYEDNHLIAVFKPVRMPVQGDISGDPSLIDVTKEWLKSKYGKPGNVFLGLVHRLDRPVSGIVVFGKTSKGASRLSEQFRARSVRKIYRALVEGIPANEAALLEGQVDGKSARLQYRVLSAVAGYAELEVELLTGRKHQIRRQLSEMGHPICGDGRYGARHAGSEIALVAKRLEFDHPTREERIVVELPEALCNLRKFLS